MSLDGEIIFDTDAVMTYVLCDMKPVTGLLSLCASAANAANIARDLVQVDTMSAYMQRPLGK